MEVRDVKGLLLITMSVNQEDNSELLNLKDSEVVTMAKRAVGNLIPENLISDILIGHEGEEMQIAISIYKFMDLTVTRRHLITSLPYIHVLKWPLKGFMIILHKEVDERFLLVARTVGGEVKLSVRFSFCTEI